MTAFELIKGTSESKAKKKLRGFLGTENVLTPELLAAMNGSRQKKHISIRQELIYNMLKIMLVNGVEIWSEKK